ncbi:MAG: glycosyltransferase family 2 protein [Deltaproteobacteria bacterium]|nr:glycosyltransferase family 2 protein [Deltaproteobacteria bacterium]
MKALPRVTPLVSIMLPCFNSQDTLPLALASCIGQSIDDWECVCLDDGSTDRTSEILEYAAARDSRFRIDRFTVNQGRGAGRQRILELVRGEYLAFLDSDDWMYPERLAREVRWLEADSKIAAVSACAAVTDGPDVLVGVQRPRAPHALPTVAMFDRPVPPPLVFPTSMIRTDLAKATGFDPAFRRSQDSDFLIRALLGKHYALGSEILYAYSQASAANLERTLEGYHYRMRSHLRHWQAHPVRVMRTLSETGAKILAYRAAGLLGMESSLIHRRWDAFDEGHRHEFAAALAQVRVAESALFESAQPATGSP